MTGANSRKPSFKPQWSNPVPPPTALKNAPREAAPHTTTPYPASANVALMNKTG